MTTATLLIACLLSAAFGVGAAVLTSLVRKSLEVRAADLAALKTHHEALAGRVTVAELAANETLKEVEALREQGRLGRAGHQDARRAELRAA